ncbi:MAG: leucine-rich repeat domain-containing protein, partial [Pseudomonadota bacterium]
PLQGLSGLQELYLDNTQVSDLSPLQGLSGLQMLRLTNTQVSDLYPLQGLSGLQGLSLNNTQVSDLAAIQGLRALQKLNLDNTQVSDLSPLAGLSGLQELDLINTQVSDLSPLQRLNELQRLYLRGTPLLEAEPALQEIYASNINGADLIQKILEWQRENGTLPPEPKPEKPLTVADLPEQEEDLSVAEHDGKLEVRPGALSPEEQDDPLRRKLHERLKRNVEELVPFGNFHYKLGQKISRLKRVLDCPYEDLDFVDVWLEIEELRADAAQDNATRDPPYEPELLSTLATTIDIGGGLVIGIEDVDKLEARRDQMRETAGPTSDEAAKELAKQIIDDPTPWGDRLRQYLGIMQDTDPEASGRFRAVNFALVRNAMIGAGQWILSNAGAGIIGGASFAVVTWMVNHPEAVTAFAESMSAGAGEWLIRLVVRAKEIFYTSAGGVPVSTPKPPFG